MSSRVGRVVMALALLAPATTMARAAEQPAGPIENPLSVQTVFPPGDPTLPDAVGIAATPIVHDDTGAFVLSFDTYVTREDLGPQVLPHAPMPWAGSAEVRCQSDGGPDVPLIHGASFLRRYRGWAALRGGAPDGWQGAWFGDYYEGGAWIYPNQPASEEPGSMTLRDALISDRPVLHRSECGDDVEGGVIDFHSVTLSAEGGDAAYQGGDRLGQVSLRLLDGWQGSVFGWFDPPGRPLDVALDVVGSPGPGESIRASVYAKRGGTWRESLPSAHGRTWQWRFHGFNLFQPGIPPGAAGAAVPGMNASLRVLPGMRIARLWPDGDGIGIETLVAPGVGEARLTPDGIVFEDIVRLPTDAHPTEEAEAGWDPESDRDPGTLGDVYGHCTHSIDDAVPAGNICAGLGTDGAGALALTDLSLGSARDLGVAGLPYLLLDGVRHTVTPGSLTEAPIAMEYQYGGVDPDRTPVTVLYLVSDHEVAGARFTVQWLAIDDPEGYGRVLLPILADLRTAAHSRAEAVWYLHPTLGVPPAMRIFHEPTGTRIPLASTHPASGDILTGTHSYRAQGAAMSLLYAPAGVGYRPSDLAWASVDGRSTFVDWTGSPSPTPVLEIPEDPILGHDVGVYKEDFFESSFGSRAYDALGPYGLLLSYAPFTVAPA